MHHERMSRICTSLLAAAATGAVIAPAAMAQGTPTTLAVEQAPTRVAAWNGVVMWSRFDAATQTYTLVKSVDGGPPVAVGVPARSGGPFDVDLGTNRGGSTFAVYTREGDIYRLNVATGRETRIDRLSSPTRAERDPTIQRGQIAFIRRDRGYDQLRVGNTTSGSRGSRLIVKRRSIVMAELGIGHIAYVVTSPGPVSDDGTKHVRVRNLRTGADRAVYRSVSGGANYADITRPTYVPSPQGFLWARTNEGSGRGNRIVRYTLRGSRFTYARGISGYSSTAWAGDALGVATAEAFPGGRQRTEQSPACVEGGVNYCVVGLTGRLEFDLGP